MNMNKYIETYEIKDIKEYCQNRCINIINENLKNKNELPHFRGKYKGYLFMIKVCNKMLKENIKIKRFELYHHLKKQQHDAKYDYNIPKDFSKGLLESIYDLMNYVSLH